MVKMKPELKRFFRLLRKMALDVGFPPQKELVLAKLELDDEVVCFEGNGLWVSFGEVVEHSSFSHSTVRSLKYTVGTTVRYSGSRDEPPSEDVVEVLSDSSAIRCAGKLLTLWLDQRVQSFIEEEGWNVQSNPDR